MIRFSDSLSTTTIDGELVILDSRSGKYFGLNPSGSRTVELLRETGELGKTLEALQREYAAPPDRLRADALALLGELKKRGLVETDEA